MAKTNWQDPKTGEIISPHISGLQEAIGKLEESLGISSTAEIGITLSEVYIAEDDRYRIYQAPEGKRNWLSSPTPVIKKNGVVIFTGFIIEYGGGAVVFTPPLLGTDVITVDVTYTVKETESIKSQLVAQKLEYVSQRQLDQLKVAKVEKDINDYQSTMATMNPNQEIKQKATGYGTVSLPKTSANGQVSVSVKGVTRTNLAKSSNMDKDTNSDGVVDDFIKWVSPNITANITFDSTKKAQKVEITGGTVIIQTEISQYIENIQAGDVVSARVNAETMGNVKVAIDILWFNGTTFISGAIGTKTTNSEIVNENKIAPANTTRIQFNIRIYPNVIGDTGTVWLKNAIVEKAITVGNYISTGTKSTVCSSRIKSINKNITNIKKIVNKQPNLLSLVEYKGKQCLSWIADSKASQMRILEGEFLPSTQYTISGKFASITDKTDLQFFYTDGTSSPILNWILNTELTYITKTSVIGKSIAYITGIWNSNQRIYVDIDSLQIEKGTVATEYISHQNSTSYLPNVGELHSLPNGTKDEVRVSGGKAEHIQRNKKYVLQASDIKELRTTGIYVDYVRVKLPMADKISWSNNKESDSTTVVIEGFNKWVNNGAGTWDFATSVGGFNTESNNTILLFFAKGTYTTLASAQTAFTGTTLTYQLASPIITPIEFSGNLLSYPSGTVYVEKVVADAGIYNNGITTQYTDLPIKVVDKLIKYDFATGVQISLDASKAVINANKLSFTHPDLVNGDMVFFDYYYDLESTEGETEIEYYDSRHTIKDTTNNKFYQWKITSTNGVPTTTLTEVL